MSVCFTYRSELIGDVPLVLMRTRYADNNNTAIMALSPTDDGEDFETFAYVTTNLGESLDAHEFFLDGDVADMVDDLEEANIARDTGIVGYSGYGQYRLMRIGDVAFDAMDEVDYDADEPCERGMLALSRYMEDPSAFRIDEFTTSRPMPYLPRGPITDGPSDGEDYEWDIPF